MNISVDFANRDLTEADVTEVDQEFIDALVEIEGQKEFPYTKCDKICKSKGGLTRHSDSKHRGESVDSGTRVNTGLCQATTASIVETIKNNIMQENIYGDEINTSLKTVSAGKALRIKGESSPAAEQAIKINVSYVGGYVGGYVVSQLFKRNKGKSSPQNEELQVLLQNMKSAESHSFISARIYKIREKEVKKRALRKDMKQKSNEL
ncbi:Hypothetical predicted protein, partial [Paramuricea clavata]